MFNPGDRVEWTNGRYGLVRGKVIKWTPDETDNIRMAVEADAEFEDPEWGRISRLYFVNAENYPSVRKII